MTDEENKVIEHVLSILNTSIPVVSHADCVAKSSAMFELTGLIKKSGTDSSAKAAIDRAMAAAEASERSAAK